VGLLRPAAGRIEIFGRDLLSLSERERLALETRWGVLFQDGALFSSLSVAQNVKVPMDENLELPEELADQLAALKLSLVGLPADAGAKYPAMLSGGMRKRSGLARALALDPEIVFLDEPTSGLDPISAADFDTLIGDLQKSLNLTVFMVTHDLDSLHAICDRVAVLVDKRLKIGTIAELMRDPHPWIQSYFSGPRGRAAARHDDALQDVR
jgi:phospholipid/cholesterol/gamma-HCH transport system ATP-binding protein